MWQTERAKAEANQLIHALTYNYIYLIKLVIFFNLTIGFHNDLNLVTFAT